MHYYTGNPKYRTWAADILKAFEEHSKGKFGFTAVDDVRQKKPTQRDSQESFFLAETLKYLYLTFAKPGTLDLDKYVFNTEAHPLVKQTPGKIMLIEQKATTHSESWTSKEKDLEPAMQAPVARRSWPPINT